MTIESSSTPFAAESMWGEIIHQLCSVSRSSGAFSKRFSCARYLACIPGPLSLHSARLFYLFLVGEVIAGWEIALATMKKGELARLLIQPSYAFGKFGCPPRIPPNATSKCYSNVCCLSLDLRSVYIVTRCPSH